MVCKTHTKNAREECDKLGSSQIVAQNDYLSSVWSQNKKGLVYMLTADYKASNRIPYNLSFKDEYHLLKIKENAMRLFSFYLKEKGSYDKSDESIFKQLYKNVATVYSVISDKNFFNLSRDNDINSVMRKWIGREGISDAEIYDGVSAYSEVIKKTNNWNENPTKHFKHPNENGNQVILYKGDYNYSDIVAFKDSMVFTVGDYEFEPINISYRQLFSVDGGNEKGKIFAKDVSALNVHNFLNIDQKSDVTDYVNQIIATNVL